jgi:hypothetical protein
MTIMHDWIRFWLKRNDHEFEEEAKRQRELHQAVPDDRRLSPEMIEWCAQYELGRHRRNQFPVGAFFDSIDPQRQNGQNASLEQLMVVAEIGQELLYEAVCTADEDDNEEFFVWAYETGGPLVDAVLQECDRNYRDTLTGRR